MARKAKRKPSRRALGSAWAGRRWNCGEYLQKREKPEEMKEG